MRLPLQIALAATVLATATTAHAQMRFQAMDTNRDGVVTRARMARHGPRASAMRTGTATACCRATRCDRGAAADQNWSQDWNRDGRVDNLDAQISQRFRGYDMNNDNRVARSEWPGDHAPVHAARHVPRRIPVDAGIHAGRRLHARLPGRSVVPVLEHRHEQRWLGDPQRVEHEQRGLHAARRESRQPHQPVRIRERHGRVSTTPRIRRRSSTRSTPIATDG